MIPHQVGSADGESQIFSFSPACYSTSYHIIAYIIHTYHYLHDVCLSLQIVSPMRAMTATYSGLSPQDLAEQLVALLVVSLICVGWIHELKQSMPSQFRSLFSFFSFQSRTSLLGYKRQGAEGMKQTEFSKMSRQDQMERSMVSLDKRVLLSAACCNHVAMP